MAKVNSKPPSRKGPPPRIDEASDNLKNKPKKSSVAKRDLNFKVDPEFKTRFKSYASSHDMTMQSLLIEAFEFYEVHHK